MRGDPKKRNSIKGWKDFLPPMSEESKKKRGLSLEEAQQYAMTQIKQHYRM